MAASSRAGESKWAKLASWEEKPPRPITEKAWIRASSQSMPSAQKVTKQAAVKMPKTTHRPLAVSRIRGVSLTSFMGPGVSALNICRPPTPSSGRMATTSTITPIPPSKCSCVRHRLIDGGSASRPERMVAPVVVSPDMVSK